MIGVAAALAVAVAAAPLATGTARWRFELAGEHVGVVELGLACTGERCAIAWASERRAPAELGGRRTSLRIEAEVDREGAWRGGKLRVVDEGAALKVEGLEGAVPASIAELVLARRVPPAARKGWQSALPSGPEVCVEVFDEPTGRQGRACAHRDGEALAVTVLGVDEVVATAADGFPASVAIPRQGARFVRDDAATTPRSAPRLNGSVVPGPKDPVEAGSFCGVPRDPDVEGDVAFLPAPRAEGAGCVERTSAWLARAARTGLQGRTAVGVAWDGSRWVWHAWAQVRLERGWIPVDPSFGQLPARGPRFTLAVHEPGDEAARIRAGERILACWGREPVRPR